MYSSSFVLFVNLKAEKIILLNRNIVIDKTVKIC